MTKVAIKNMKRRKSKVHRAVGFFAVLALLPLVFCSCMSKGTSAPSGNPSSAGFSPAVSSSGFSGTAPDGSSTSKSPEKPGEFVRSGKVFAEECLAYIENNLSTAIENEDKAAAFLSLCTTGEKTPEIYRTDELARIDLVCDGLHALFQGVIREDGSIENTLEVVFDGNAAPPLPEALAFGQKMTVSDLPSAFSGRENGFSCAVSAYEKGFRVYAEQSVGKIRRTMELVFVLNEETAFSQLCINAKQLYTP